VKKLLFTITLLGVVVFTAKSQTSDDILNVLTQKKLIKASKADSIRSASKNSSTPVLAGKKIQLSGYTQVRYRSSAESGKADGFDIRRARLGLRGNLSKVWGYRLQFELAGTPKILDAYAEAKLNDCFKFTFGQAKIPFSLENLEGSARLDLIDRSQVVEALVSRGSDVLGNQSGRDIGIQVGGTLVKHENRSLLDYRLGIFNGGGINTADKNDNKDFAARLVVHPIAGLDLGASLYNGKRFVPGQTSGTVTTPSRNVDRNRYGFELAYDYKSLNVTGEYIHGNDGNTDREGYYVKAGYYFVPKKFQFVAKYDFYDPNLDITDNAPAWYVLGGNYYFISNAKLQLNYTIKQEQGTSIDNNLATLQLQINF
jgi:hypothetical protein